MKLILPRYSMNYGLLPFSTEEEAKELGLTFEQPARHEGGTENYVVHWGLNSFIPNFGAKYGVMETGFFHKASFIDTVGNYQSLSLNTAEGYTAVAEFELEGRKSAREIIFNRPKNMQSKFNAAYNETEVTEWDGPILILQNPTDRSIFNSTSKENYLKFVDDACKFYGDKLFVKFHPWNSNEHYKLMEDIVKPHGCSYGKAQMGIIEKAEFCLAYNSTFAVDAFLRGVPYVQFGMGTFFQAYGVIWSKGTFPVSVPRYDDLNQLPDFLIHKFCYNKHMDKYKFAAMIKHYSESNEMFPMTDEFSYANNLPDE